MRSISIHFNAERTSGINVSAPELLHQVPGASTDAKAVACGLGFKVPKSEQSNAVLFLLSAEEARTIGEKLIAFAEEQQE